MRYLVRLLALVPAALIILSTLTLATTAQADGPNPDLDPFRGNHAGQAVEPHKGWVLGDTGFVPAPPVERAMPQGSGVDATTVALVVLSGAAAIGLGAAGVVTVRRHHHLAHPA